MCYRGLTLYYLWVWGNAYIACAIINLYNVSNNYLLVINLSTGWTTVLTVIWIVYMFLLFPSFHLLKQSHACFYLLCISGQITKPYKSAIDCFLQTLRSEGALGLYKGFVPNWMRIGPHTIVTFFVFEQLRKLVGMEPVWCGISI